MLVDADIAGGKSSICGTTFTVGCSPSKVRAVPPHALFEEAVAVQLVRPGEPGAVVEKENMRLPPGSINALELLLVRFKAPFENMQVHDEGGSRIEIDDGAENSVGTIMAAEPRFLSPVFVKFTVYVLVWLMYTTLGVIAAVKAKDKASVSNITLGENASKSKRIIVAVLWNFFRSMDAILFYFFQAVN